MNFTRHTFWVLFIALAFGCGQQSEPKPSAKETTSASVAFLNAKDGDTLKSPFVVKFGVTGMSVVTAGSAKSENAGHHHLIIDGKPIPYGTMVPMDAQHLHFMKGETEHTLALKPGKHTLTLQFAGIDHRSFGIPLSKTITVTVEGKLGQAAGKTGKEASSMHSHGQMKHAHGDSAAQQPVQAGEEKKSFFFVAPTDGQVIPPSVSIRFGAKGFVVTPAGQYITDTNRGHHHLIIDGKPVPKGQVVPADKTHIHFGKGQIETRILLDHGPHTLTLQFADGAHRSFGPEFSQTIKVMVKPMHVFFVSPPNNATISTKSIIQFGVFGATVTPAGQHIGDSSRGHHHLIIDDKPVARGQVVPADKTHIHFGKGQTQVDVHSLGLTPGQHTITLQFADGAHRSLGPEMSKTMSIKVEDK